MKRDLYGELLGNALNRGAPPGHFAAYIRPDESNVLRSMGGGVAPDGGQNMYNGMPAYFSGISAVSGGGGGGVSFGYGDGGVSIPSYSVDAPSVSPPDQGFIDQMNANAAIANARAEAAAEEMALADILAGVQESMGGRSAPAGIPASMIGGATPDGVAVGSGRVSQLPQGATSTPFGLMYTSPTQEAIAAQIAADKANNTLLGKALPGDRDVYQTLSGAVGTGLSGVGSDLAKGAVGAVTGLTPVLAVMSLASPDREGSIAFVDALDSRPSYSDNFDMDDVSVPSTDELDAMVAALAPTDPTDPTDPASDPATPAPDSSNQYATVAPDILARILANEQYGRRRMGLT